MRLKTPLIVLALVVMGVVVFNRSLRRPNVLLVITDTTRVDRFGCYGNQRGLTPYMDDLASQGVRFEQASSHAPWTLPSIASMLTSLHPKQHGAGGRLGSFTSLDPGVTTLPAVFGRAGYRTHAIANVAFLSESFGVTRDFDDLDLVAPANNLEMRDAERTTDAALAWIEEAAEGEQPFFLLVHYFDPHAVYAPPQPFRSRFAAPPDQTDESWVFGTRGHMEALRDGSLPVPLLPVLRRASKLYDGEVAYMDAQIGRLLDGLAELGLGDDTIVALTADHGEEFGDHGGFEHGHTVYDELTHVPLILRYPRALKPGVVSASVGHVDLAPTLCELADVAPPEQFVGQSLLRFLRDPGTPSSPILAHGNMWADPSTSFRVGHWKLIVGAQGRVELYDWRADPGEQNNLAGSEPGTVRALGARLKEAEDLMGRLGRGVPVEIRGELLKTLQGLGYSGSEEEGETQD